MNAPIRNGGWVVSAVVLGVFLGCMDLEQEAFKVELKYPDGKLEDLGEVKGITQCREKAAIRALYVNLQKGEWDYSCCRLQSDDDCMK